MHPIINIHTWCCPCPANAYLGCIDFLVMMAVEVRMWDRFKVFSRALFVFEYFKVDRSVTVTNGVPDGYWVWGIGYRPHPRCTLWGINLFGKYHHGDVFRPSPPPNRWNPHGFGGYGAPSPSLIMFKFYLSWNGDWETLAPKLNQIGSTIKSFQ